MLDGDDETLSTRLPKDNTHYSRQSNAPFPPYAEFDPLNTLPSHNFGSNGDSEVEGDLDESLAGLELNGNDDFSNNELPDSNSIDMYANRSQRVPEATSPWLLSEFESHRTCEPVRYSTFQAQAF